MSYVEVDGITKHYGDVTAVQDISFTLEEGELLTLLGPSGCGKTTTLDIIAGLTDEDAGEIYLKGEEITDTSAEHRSTVKVFQEYALFPHMTVGENVGYGLKMDGVAKQEREERIQEVLELVELGGYEDRDIADLSGGQRQRVATSRALVTEPSVLLLDEPFSALDLKLRENLQFELKKLQEELGITAIHVTHDQEEAMVLSDKIVVLNDGEKMQEGSPLEIYEEPNNAFVADFIGKSNMLTGKIHKMNGELSNINIGTEMETKRIEATPVGNGFSANESEEVMVVVRPEKCDLSLKSNSTATGNQLNAFVEHKFVLGSITQYRLSLQDEIDLTNRDQEFIVEDKNRGMKDELQPGDDVVISFNPEHTKLISQRGT